MRLQCWVFVSLLGASAVGGAWRRQCAGQSQRGVSAAWSEAQSVLSRTAASPAAERDGRGRYRDRERHGDDSCNLCFSRRKSLTLLRKLGCFRREALRSVTGLTVFPLGTHPSLRGGMNLDRVAAPPPPTPPQPQQLPQTRDVGFHLARSANSNNRRDTVENSSSDSSDAELPGTVPDRNRDLNSA